MTATQYKGPRLCSCGHKAEVVINTGRDEASHITLLCWRCAHAVVGMLLELDMLCAEEESGVSTVGFNGAAQDGAERTMNADTDGVKQCAS